MPCNLFDRAAQYTGVVNRKVGDACHHRVCDDICAVIFAANTAFYHCRINSFTHVGMERQKRQEAEIARLDGWVEACFFCRSFEAVPCLEEVACELVFIQRLVAYLYAFADEA